MKQEISAEQALIDAILSKNFKMVKRILHPKKMLLWQDTTKKININILNEWGVSPLQAAIHINSFDLVQYLIKQGANIEQASQNNKGYVKPLHLAVLYDNEKIIRFLIKQDANINSQTEDGDTPLILAAEKGLIDTSQILLEAGANINATNKYKQTALHASVFHAHNQNTRLLIEAGADVNIQDINGETPVFNETNEDLVTLFLNHHADITIKNKAGVTLLHKSVLYNMEKTTKLLIENNLDVNATDNNGQTPLHLAAKLKNKNIAQILIENGANIDTKDKNGDTPLIIAALAEEADTFVYLAKQGTDLTIPRKNGETIVELAVKSKNPKMIQYLVKQNLGNDILKAAAKRQNLKLIKELLKQGEAKNKRNVQLAQIKKEITPIIQSLSFDKLLNLPQTAPTLLRKIAITNELSTVLKPYNYEQLIQIYKSTHKILPHKSRQTFEQMIRFFRTRKENQK